MMHELLPKSIAEWHLLLAGDLLGVTVMLAVMAAIIHGLRRHYERGRMDGRITRRCVAIKSGAWSDSSTWLWGDVPAEGDTVVIPEHITVKVDADAYFD